MMYMLVYILTKNLPWHNSAFNVHRHKREVALLKLTTLAEQVCLGDAEVLVHILRKFYSMEYTEEPDY